MGLAELSQENDFKGKTIKLGTDIVLNKVDKPILKQWRNGEAVPSNTWTLIGNFWVPFLKNLTGMDIA